MGFSTPSALVLGGIPTKTGATANVTSKDLNTIVDPGLYYTNGSQSWTNGPTTSVNTATKMFVFKAIDTERIQIILCMNPNAQEIHYRGFNVGDTTATWYKVS